MGNGGRLFLMGERGARRCRGVRGTEIVQSLDCVVGGVMGVVLCEEILLVGQGRGLRGRCEGTIQFQYKRE